MPTITTDTYLDGGVARTAGETWTVNAGAKFTVRTDSRIHANAPASMTGSLGSITCNDGEVIFDGRNVRWMAYDAGTGNVPAIGTTITGGTSGANGYLLAVYSDINVAPTAVGAAMPATGFIKLREADAAYVDNDVLTGIGATTNGIDRLGWIEVVADDASTHTFSRLGKHTIRGGWFYLNNTDGSIGQLIKLPSNSDNYTVMPGLWIERDTARASTYTWVDDVITVTLTDHGYYVEENIDIDFIDGDATDSGTYKILEVIDEDTFTISLIGSGDGGDCDISFFEYYPALDGEGSGWYSRNIGSIPAYQDNRTKFVSNSVNRSIYICQAGNYTGPTYANVAAQASTYATLSYSCTYTWASDIVTVFSSSTHLLKTGMSVGLFFTSGDAIDDGIYTITVIDPYTYTVPLAGSGAGGSVTARPGVTITFTAHTLGVGDNIYCDFTSGTGVDGDYEIYGVTSANAYIIAYPHMTVLTSGNVSTYSRYRITHNSHPFAVGNLLYFNFTSGAGVDGAYPIVASTTNTYDIVMNNGSAADSGNVNIELTTGYTPPSGRRIRIPNVILRGCATGTRATNNLNSTIGSRPEWAVSTAGAIDFEYVNSTWYHNFAQAYSVKMKHFTTYDTIVLTEVATSLDVDDGGVSTSQFALDLRTIQLTACYAGGNISNVRAERGGTPGNTDHSMEILSCDGLTLTNVRAGIVQFARSTGKALNISNSNNITLNNCYILNSDLPINGSFNIQINNLDVCDRYIGYTNTGAYYSINIGSKSNNIVINGVTYGFKGSIPNVHSYSGLLSAAYSSNIKLRNIGGFSSPLSTGTWRPNLYASGYLYVSGGNNNNIKIQRCYIDKVRTSLISTTNSDKNVIFESLYSNIYQYAAYSVNVIVNAQLNSIIKGCRSGINSVTGQASVYGTHFCDIFTSDITGRIILAMNEPTVETSNLVTIVTGVPRFNSSGQLIMKAVNDEVIIEQSYFAKGHTGFLNTAPVVTGTNVTYASGPDWGNHDIYYQIDKGSGYGGSWQDFTAANLSAETGIDPAIGFKLKYRIVCDTASDTNAITYIRIETTSNATAQEENLYPLDTIKLTLTDLQSGSDIVFLEAGTETELINVDNNSGTTYDFIYETPETVDIGVFKIGYIPLKIRNYELGSVDGTLSVLQIQDRNYNNP